MSRQAGLGQLYLEALSKATNKQVEQRLLACAILDHEECVEGGFDSVTSSMFTSDIHLKVFSAIRELAKAGKPVGVSSVGGIVKDLGCDLIEFTKIVESVPSAASVKDHLSAARDLAAKRTLIVGAFKAIDSWVTNGASVEAIEGGMRSAVERSRSISNNEAARQIGNFVDGAIESMKRGPADAISTGVSALDKILGGGLRPSRLYVLAARPSVGKTTLSLNITHNVAKRGTPVLFVSLEQSAEELATKSLVLDANDVKESAVAASGDSVKRLPIFVLDGAHSTLPSLMAAIKKAVSQNYCQLVVIDYLGLMPPESMRQSLYERTSAASRTMKLLAKELNVPILVIAQLNREIEKHDKRSIGHSPIEPQMHHLRDSGAIEQDADVVMMMMRLPSPEAVRLFVRKNRHGALGDVDFQVDLKVSRFTEYNMGFAVS